MANAFSKEETVLFEDVLEGFESDNLSAKHSSVFNPADLVSERSGDTIWRPQPYITQTKDGWDMSGEFDDLTQLSVPATANIVKNVPFQMNARELRDPQQRDKINMAAKQQLSAAVNRSIANLVSNTGSLVVTSANAASGYSDIADAEARLGSEEVGLDSERCYMANMSDYKLLAADLAERQTMSGKPTAAYERSYVGPMAGFETYRTSFQPTLAGSSGSSTMTGAQSYVPLATQTNAINGGESNVDNRYQTITVGDSSSFAAGDAVEIAGVNACSMINKEDLGETRKFRVISVDSGTTMTISPPIINAAGATVAEQAYGNCTAAAAGGAAITAVNTTSARTNTFWTKDSIEIFGANVAMPETDFAGLATLTGQTDSGIQMILAKSGNIDDLTAKYRWTIYYGATNLQPTMNGIQLFGQV